LALCALWCVVGLGGAVAWGQEAQPAAPCAVLRGDCAPQACSTRLHDCPQGQFCLQALDAPPDEGGERDGYCEDVFPRGCASHAQCGEGQRCYDDGNPLCEGAAQGPDHPPCEEPETVPYGRCAPPTECSEDHHCPDGMGCARYSTSVGGEDTRFGRCVPAVIPCAGDEACPLPSPWPSQGGAEVVWACERSPDGAGWCVPGGHKLVCEAGGCALLRADLPASGLDPATPDPTPQEEPDPTEDAANNHSTDDSSGVVGEDLQENPSEATPPADEPTSQPSAQTCQASVRGPTVKKPGLGGVLGGVFAVLLFWAWCADVFSVVLQALWRGEPPKSPREAPREPRG
jgi:hypothetical protein